MKIIHNEYFTPEAISSWMVILKFYQISFQPTS